MRQIDLVVIDVRSAYNVGSLLRTADAMAIKKVYLVGITPYPAIKNDRRLPHVIAKTTWDIHKTALGAEKSLDIAYLPKTNLKPEIVSLKSAGITVVALEQTPDATKLIDYQPPDKIAIIVGNEVKGLTSASLRLADRHLAIPMLGRKESLNVAVAAGIALYYLRFTGVDKL